MEQSQGLLYDYTLQGNRSDWATKYAYEYEEERQHLQYGYKCKKNLPPFESQLKENGKINESCIEEVESNSFDGVESRETTV